MRRGGGGEDSACRGFTLIELVTALAVMSLLGVMAYRGLDTVLVTRAHVAAESVKWRRLSAFFERFERDVQRAIERPARSAAGERPAMSGARLAGGAARLEFSRAALSHDAPAQRVGYAYDGARHAVVLTLWPALDHVAAAGAEDHDVLSAVARFEVDYMDSDRIWRTAWGGGAPGAALPRALRVRVGLDTGEAIVRVFAVRA